MCDGPSPYSAGKVGALLSLPAEMKIECGLGGERPHEITNSTPPRGSGRAEEWKTKIKKIENFDKCTMRLMKEYLLVPRSFVHLLGLSLAWS